jgi:hypothetical protein
MSVKSPGGVIGGSSPSFATATVTGATPSGAVTGVAFGTTTSGTATAGAATLPTNPVGFLEINISGTVFKIPYYAV